MASSRDGDTLLKSSEQLIIEKGRACSKAEEAVKEVNTAFETREKLVQQEIKHLTCPIMILLIYKHLPSSASALILCA